MRETLTTQHQPSQANSISRVIFTVDRAVGKIVSVAPVVDSDEELNQLERWLEACILLAALIRPKKAVGKAA
jgi:hypothetical protein